MSIANFEEIEDFSRACLERACGAAKAIHFTMNESLATKESRNIRASLIGDEPKFASLDTEYGMAAWAVILSVDLRQSSRRAVEIGARNTYLTMHTYLKTMAKLVTDSRGLIVGLRGDGLIASFGLSERTGAPDDFKPHVATDAAKMSTSCGKAMVEATEEILNPLLKEHDIRGDLQIGVGIACGEIVVTRIGLLDANEVTTYGPPVNQACKMSNKTGILLTPAVENYFPTSKGGLVKFKQSSDGLTPIYPPGVYMLDRSQTLIKQRKPR